MARPSVDSVVQVPFVGHNSLIDYRWLRVLKALETNLPPDGAGDVVDGSATSYAPMILFQGPDSSKPGTPDVGSIYFALDTGSIYWASSGTWNELSEELTGDVLKPANSTVTSLANVFSSPGTYGTATQIPRLTIDSKGRITGLALETINIPSPTAAGTNGQLQFNNTGVLGGTSGITFSGGALSFLNPLPTFNNLSPLTTKGDVLTHSGASNVRLPVGVNDQALIANSATASGLDWQAIVNSVIAGTGVSVSAATGNVTISNTGVISFSAGTTGLTPSTATTGDLVLDGVLEIAHGGTGETTANDAFNALAPDQTGNTGKYLTTDGTNTSWVTIVSGGFVPYFIPSGDTFVIPEFQQALFNIAIDNEGTIDNEGILVYVG